jgi:hypothetical protein
LFELLSDWDAGRMFGPKANQASSATVSALPALEFLPISWFHLAADIQISLWGKTLFTAIPHAGLSFLVFSARLKQFVHKKMGKMV